MAKMVNPSVEMASVGVQNRRTLSTLLPSRLAIKNRAKDTTAISQHQGEKMPARRLYGSNPTAPCPLILLRPLTLRTIAKNGARQLLPNRTGYAGKHIVRIRSDESDGADDDY